MCLDLAIGVLRALFEKALVRQGRFGAKFAKRQLFFDTQIFLFRIQKVIFGIHTAVRQGFNVGFCQSKCFIHEFTVRRATREKELLSTRFGSENKRQKLIFRSRSQRRS